MALPLHPRPPGTKHMVFDGHVCLGEVEIFPTKDPPNFQFLNKEIRINHLSPSSERCPPLSILQTISPFDVRFKLQCKSPIDRTPLLFDLNAVCYHDRKTAVVILGDEEMHLVAMPTKQFNFPCFWGCYVKKGLYNSCLGMLNLRCLAIVFDLDETLIVANTMKSFEDRIETLQRKIVFETDPFRVSVMSAELNRYVEDKALLKQYSESDCVVDGKGKLIKVQMEEVPPLSNNHEDAVRPVIRLPDKNIVLTRINPEVRDTSVLVRLRPSWEDLRSYLNAKGRKRFEVYVCTMAERDYALEMWRLLDPEANLITTKQLMDRVVCVKSGLRKSLLHVFQDGGCHPKLTMVIDDRMKVWDDKDQSRVHMVPPFTPYYAPQAEAPMENVVPVLCVARNVACNVRGGFFREFDETLLRKICEIYFEDDVTNLPYSPDVSDYLMPEFQENGVPLSGFRDIPVAEGVSSQQGVNASAVERRSNRTDEKSGADSGTTFISNNVNLRPVTSKQHLLVSSSNGIILPSSRTSTPLQRPPFPGVTVRVEVNQSESDPDTKGKLPILQHGQDSREVDPIDPSSGPILHASSTVIQPSGGWLVVEDDISQEKISEGTSEGLQISDSIQSNRLISQYNSLGTGEYDSFPSDRSDRALSHIISEEVRSGDLRQRQNLGLTTPSLPAKVIHSTGIHSDPGNSQPSIISISVLQEIGRRCNAKVEFRKCVSSNKDFPVSVEVLFTGDKIGSGMGRTMNEAQLKASVDALQYLASKYQEHVESDSRSVSEDREKLLVANENGFLRDNNIPDSSAIQEFSKKKTSNPSNTTEELEVSDYSKRSSLVISGINELCIDEGFSLSFQDRPSAPMNLKEGDHYFQVEIPSGQVLDKGIALSGEGAKLKAAGEALGCLKSMVNQSSQKHLNSSRSTQTNSSKQFKD